MSRYLNFMLILACLLQPLSGQDRPSQPNFVVILVDDLGWQDVACYDIDGSPVFETPYIDALAEEGILFWEGYSPAPTCSPSRGAILSGKHPARIQRTHVGGGIVPQPYQETTQRMMVPYYQARLDTSEVIIAEALGDDYFTGHSGKWHVAISHNASPLPLEHGFDWSKRDRGVTTNMGDRTTGFATNSASDPYQLDENGFAFDQTTQNALDFMTEAVTGAETSAKPFFLYFATWLVHTPIHMRTESLLVKYADKMGYTYPLSSSETFPSGQKNPYYAAMVETLDYNVHQVVDYLKTTDDPRWPGHKLIENTYIFFTSDNGGMEKSGEEITDNYPLDQGKIRLEEGGTRVPFIIVGPDIPKGLQSNVMINGMDMYPTILSMAGITPTWTIDGCDLSDLLKIDPQDSSLVKDQSGNVRDTMYWHFPQTGKFYSTIRQGGWKLFQNYDHVDNTTAPYRLYELYDSNGARNDIEEANNLYSTDTLGIAGALANELNEWLEEVDAAFPSYNYKYSGTLTNKEFVPSILSRGDGNGFAWVEYETINKAEVIEANLIYTTNGGANYEEWFKAPATIVSPGRVEAWIPEGTTHYVFSLIDENNFLVTSVDVGYERDGFDDSELVPTYVYRFVYEGPHTTMFATDFDSEALIDGGILYRDSSGFVRRSDSAWNLSSGSLANLSSNDSKVGESAVGRIFDLSDLDEDIFDELTVSFDYTLAEVSESLHVHIWGYVDVSSTSSTRTMNLGATNGNAWESANGEMVAYNLGKADGAFTGTPGIADDAAIVVTNISGSGQIEKTFVLSDFLTAPNDLAKYDYLAIGFARKLGGTAPAVTIDNLRLSIPSDGGYGAWVEEYGLTEYEGTHDPDADGVLNLLEYSLGGDPTVPDVTVLPYMEMQNNESEVITFVYRRRRDASEQGLVYTPKSKVSLSDTQWVADNITEVGSTPIVGDYLYELVTCTVQTTIDQASVFVRLEVEEL